MRTVNTMNAPANSISKKTESLSIIRRIAEKDKTAVQDCIDTYGNFIWTLARKFTNSTGEAEVVSRKIFTDIWRYAEGDGKNETAENLVIARIALQRLIKPSVINQTKSMQSIDTKNEQGADTEFGMIPNSVLYKISEKNYEKP